MIEIRWHGRGGQGAFTAAKIFGAAAVAEGRYALAFPSFGPERRGAPIQAFTKIDDAIVKDRSEIRNCDYIVIIDETLYSPAFLDALKKGGRIYINTKTPEKYSDSRITVVDADTISMHFLNRPVSNTAMAAVLAADTGIVSSENIEKSLYQYLPEKVAEKNVNVVNHIFEKDVFRRQIADSGIKHQDSRGGK